MKLKNKIPYNIKKTLPILSLAAASLFISSCDKEDEPIVPTIDVELEVNQFSLERLYESENGVFSPGELAVKYAQDPLIRTVYLVPIGSWSNFSALNISEFRKFILKSFFDYSSKFKGKGDFNFALGEASKVPEDSLWYVSKGWTINKYRTGPWAKGKSR